MELHGPPLGPMAPQPGGRGELPEKTVGPIWSSGKNIYFVYCFCVLYLKRYLKINNKYLHIYDSIFFPFMVRGVGDKPWPVWIIQPCNHHTSDSDVLEQVNWSMFSPFLQRPWETRCVKTTCKHNQQCEGTHYKYGDHHPLECVGKVFIAFWCCRNKIHAHGQQ